MQVRIMQAGAVDAVAALRGRTASPAQRIMLIARDGGCTTWNTSGTQSRSMPQGHSTRVESARESLPSAC
ncbi:hypothetical protein ACNQVK_32875 [Mycobacterium sp. 134]|uniref:hypothetical protein n=1 Tax=Mycobacterium sp. 134 TaxID=3400425 RepID=UPI003AAABDDC